jgi:hypothetical protein
MRAPAFANHPRILCAALSGRILPDHAVVFGGEQRTRFRQIQPRAAEETDER